MALVVHCKKVHDHTQDDTQAIVNVDQFLSCSPTESSILIHYVRHISSLTRLRNPNFKIKESPLWWNEAPLSNLTKYLDFRSLIVFGKLSAQLSKLDIHDDLWKRLCEVEFGVAKSCIRESPPSSKQLFQYLHLKREQLMYDAFATPSSKDVF